VKLLKRFEKAELYGLGGRKHRLVVGGDISNCLNFDNISKIYLREKYKLSDAERISDGVYRLRTGKYGYEVNLNTSSIKIFPVRGNWSKYIEIFRLVPQPMDYNQINDVLLELYVNTDQFRWGFLITDLGFKLHVKLKEGYSGSGVLKVGFRTNGLARIGRKIYDGDDFVIAMKPAFLTDSSEVPILRAVSEDVSNSVATLECDLNGLTFPVIIDPTFGPSNPSKDANILEDIPLSGFGQNTESSIRNETSKARRNVTQFDASAIPAGSTIDSVTAEWMVLRHDAGSPTGLSVDITRLKQYTWNDDGVATPNSECNWVNYLTSGPTAWPVGSGAADVDVALGVSTTTVPAPTNFMQFTDANAIAIMQDALDNQSGLFNVRLNFQTEGVAGGSSSTIAIGDLENGTAGNRPQLTVDYTSAEVLMGGGFGDDDILMELIESYGR
jgi:hypothetical protein